MFTLLLAIVFWFVEIRVPSPPTPLAFEGSLTDFEVFSDHNTARFRVVDLSRYGHFFSADHFPESGASLLEFIDDETSARRYVRVNRDGTISGELTVNSYHVVVLSGHIITPAGYYSFALDGDREIERFAPRTVEYPELLRLAERAEVYHHYRFFELEDGEPKDNRWSLSILKLDDRWEALYTQELEAPPAMKGRFSVNPYQTVRYGSSDSPPGRASLHVEYFTPERYRRRLRPSIGATAPVSMPPRWEGVVFLRAVLDGVPFRCRTSAYQDATDEDSFIVMNAEHEFFGRPQVGLWVYRASERASYLLVPRVTFGE